MLLPHIVHNRHDKLSLGHISCMFVYRPRPAGMLSRYIFIISLFIFHILFHFFLNREIIALMASNFEPTEKNQFFILFAVFFFFVCSSCSLFSRSTIMKTQKLSKHPLCSDCLLIFFLSYLLRKRIE